MKMKMKNYGKMGLSFEFSMKICEKKHFQSFFKTFFTNWGKNEDEDEKI